MVNGILKAKRFKIIGRATHRINPAKNVGCLTIPYAPNLTNTMFSSPVMLLFSLKIDEYNNGGVSATAKRNAK